MFDLQNLFLKEKSFDNYNDAAILETLLISAGIRKDIDAVIARLFDTFGSFKGILEAQPAELMNVTGVTRKICTMISMVVPLARAWERANLSEVPSIKNRNAAESYCKSLLMGEKHEKFVVIALNAQCRVNGYRTISEGSLSEVQCYPRSVVEACLSLNAHSIILSHNHPGGTESPSPEDIHSTLTIQKILKSIGVTLLDHIIVCGTNTYSMISHGDISYNSK